MHNWVKKMVCLRKGSNNNINYSSNSTHNQSDFPARESSYLVSSSASWLMDTREKHVNEDMKADLNI